ncbi:hypothetical protein HPB51_025411 [Rhipicephalus microplus]|uniref:Uncharacterized protein n=1 Tax=Rhipicephalus microplus TaxID=6941 RepID=A0A9J6D7Q7_RHIMP|nr:hypothetical protein HPB51_025411 [Rhipicephalus microplus]
MCAAESSLHRIKPIDRNRWKGRLKKATKDASYFNFESNRITTDEAVPHALVDSDALDIARRLRKCLKKNGPSLEEDLLIAMRPSHVQYVIHAYGTLAAFMDLLSGFEQDQEGRYMLLCYEGLDGKVWDCSSSSHTQEERSHGLYSSGSSYDGLQCADDSEPECEPCSSSSSSCYEPAVEEQPEEKRHRLRDASCQTPLSCYSREVKHIKKRLQIVRRNEASEAQQLRLKIEQLVARPQVSTPHYGVRTRNRTAPRERKPVDKNRAYGKVSPPRLPLQQRILPVRHIPENNLLTPPVETKIRPMAQADKKYSRSERSVKEVHKLRGSEKSADKRTDVESVGSSQGKTENSSTDMQISRIFRMAKKHRPDVTNTEIREPLRHVRLAKGGFSDMIFSAIVDLALGQLKDGPEDRVKACEGRPLKARSSTRN